LYADHLVGHNARVVSSAVVSRAGGAKPPYDERTVSANSFHQTLGVLGLVVRDGCQRVAHRLLVVAL